MKNLIVLIAVMAIGLGCGKTEKDPHEGHDHGKGGHSEQAPAEEKGKPQEDHSGHDHGKEGDSHGKPGAKGSEAEKEGHAEHAEGGERVGPGLAVEAYEIEEGRIKLSEKAVKRLGLKMEKVVLRDGVVSVPSQVLGNEDGEPFVYIREPEGWLKRTFVTIASGSGTETIVVAGLTSGTEFVTQGASFVRLAELDLLAGDAVDSCGGH